MELYRVSNRLEYFKLNQAIHTGLRGAAWERGADGDARAHLQSRIKRLRFIGNEGPVKWAGPWPSTKR